jgi:hypothetical protein
MTPDARPNNAMPKWLLYGLLAKGIAIIVIVLTVLWYAGILG